MDTYKIISPKGEAREVSEKEFQDKIDEDLAEFNDGKKPTTDEERKIIIDKIKKTSSNS